MAATTKSVLTWALKTLLRGQEAENAVIRNHVLLDMIQKDTEFGGDNEPWPVIYAPGVGVSSSHSQANTLKTGMGGKKFALTNGRLFGAVPVDDEALMAARKDMHAFIKLKAEEVMSVQESMGETLNTWGYSNGGGALATVTSINTGADTMVVSNINPFEVGQELIFSDDDGSSSSHALNTAQFNIASIDRNTKTITYTVTSGADTNVGAADYIFLLDSWGGASAANNALPLKGLGAWHPLTVTSTAFFGVDRTADSRLSGALWTGTNATNSGSNLNRLKRGANHANSTFKSRSRTSIVHPDVFLDISTELENAGAVRTFERKGLSGYTGHEAIAITTSYGSIDLHSDPATPVTDGWILDPKYCYLKSMGKLVHVYDRDGSQWLRDSASGATPTMTLQLVSYPQYAEKRPWLQTRITMDDPNS